MNKEIQDRALNLLRATYKTPKMFCHLREALLAHVSAIALMVNPDFPVQDLYKRHAEHMNKLSGPYEDEWASKLIDEVILFVTKQ